MLGYIADSRLVECPNPRKCPTSCRAVAARSVNPAAGADELVQRMFGLKVIWLNFVKPIGGFTPAGTTSVRIFSVVLSGLVMNPSKRNRRLGLEFTNLNSIAAAALQARNASSIPPMTSRPERDAGGTSTW